MAFRGTLFREAQALDLAAPDNRIDQLAHFLETVGDRVDRDRVTRNLGVTLRSNAVFGPVLRDLYRWKLDAWDAHYLIRLAQISNLAHILTRFQTLYNNHPHLPSREQALRAVQSFLFKNSQLIARAAQRDRANNRGNPEGTLMLVLRALGVDIRNPQERNDEPSIEDVIDEQPNVEEPAPAPSRNNYRPPDAIARLLEHFQTPNLFVRDLIPVEYHNKLLRRPDLVAPLDELFRRSMDVDAVNWQVERGAGDNHRIFYREVVFRLLNSLRHLQLHDGGANAQMNNYFISIDSAQESKIYRLTPDRLYSLINELGKRLEQPGVRVEEDNETSGAQRVVAEALSTASRVRFGGPDTIYDVIDDGNGGYRYIEPQNYLNAVPRALYNLTAVMNPFGTFRQVINLRANQVQPYLDRLRNLNNIRTLMRPGTAGAVSPAQVTDLANNRIAIRGQQRRRRYHVRNGNFFPFFNLSKYDLSRYQIPKLPRDLESPDFDDCCLIFALRKSGVLTETELTELDAGVITRQLKPSKMNNYLLKLGVLLILKTIREPWIEAKLKGEKLPSNKYCVDSYGLKGSNRIIKLFLLCGHFMLDEETPIKRYSFMNEDKIFKQRYPIIRKKAPNGMEYDSNDEIDNIDEHGWKHINTRRAGMLSSELITELYIRYKKGEPYIFKPMRFDDVSSLKSIAFKDTKKKRRNEEILERLAIYPIKQIQEEEWNTLIYTNNSIKPLISPDQQLKHKGHTKVKVEDIVGFRIFYADFESCTADNEGTFLEAHVPFMCCIRESQSDNKATFIGPDCGQQLLDWVLNICPVTRYAPIPLIYFHNLSYDINFLMKYGIANSVNRNSLILQSDILYKGREIRLKDSYGLLSMPLRTMAHSFKIQLEKEIFPYTYYSPERVMENKGDVNEVFELEDNWSCADKEQFINNLTKLGEKNLHAFDMLKYAKFYCERDVDVLQRCIDIFHEQVLDSFKIDCHKVISISSIADKYLRNTVYYPFGQMYLYGNHIRDFLLDAVHGGRVMCARNERHYFKASDREHGLWDLDAVSLYPSAMSCLYTVGGPPEVLQLWELNWDYLNNNQYISAYVVEIYITEIRTPRDFPLVILKDPKTGKITNTNDPPVRMTVCDIELKDLVEFQDIKFDIIRGLKWMGPKDYRLQEIVKDLFNKRAQYKQEKNPLENSYKLLLNSIYGKTIQKAIDHEYKYYRPQAGFKTWLINHSNYIENMTVLKDSDIIRLKQIMPINRHFNNTLLGVQILAMSKHLMNRVMCLADDLHLDVYYQDTDSMHIRRDQVPLLERAFFERYGSPLRGTDLCQFHPDFDPIASESIPSEVTAIESYFLGKKCYCDKLTDQLGNIGYHIRMKGVSSKSIEHVADGDILGLYKRLFDGETIIFDLCCDGQVKFDNAKDGTVRTKNSFERAVKATACTEIVPFNERWEIDLITDLYTN